jgi:hypothetical protein
MKTEFTPGPWVIDWNVSRLDVFSADAATLVATLQRSMMSPGIDSTAKANARLIAAAPDLYDALQACHEAMQYMSEYDIPINLPGKVEAALNKARGE